MDYKIYNIELVNRLSAWQHTAFKTKTSIPIALPDREQVPAAKAGEPPPDQQEPVDPLNVITWDAADFVLCHKVRCSFRCPPTRCRGLLPGSPEIEKGDVREDHELQGTAVPGQGRRPSGEGGYHRRRI